VEDILEELARSLNNNEKIQWEDLDDVLLNLGVSQGDRRTHILALMYIVIKKYQRLGKKLPFYRDLRKKIAKRFKIINSGFIKTSSVEVWELWKKEEKEIRKKLKIYREESKILEKKLLKEKILYRKKRRKRRQKRKLQLEQEKNTQD
jgi:hypothetical protein